jgi:hypothetical protein
VRKPIQHPSKSLRPLFFVNFLSFQIHPGNGGLFAVDINYESIHHSVHNQSCLSVSIQLSKEQTIAIRSQKEGHHDFPFRGGSFSSAERATRSDDLRKEAKNQTKQKNQETNNDFF